MNAIGVHALALSIEDDEGNQCDIREIAIDGIYLPEPRVPRFGRSLVVSGGRLDWLVICDKPGAYKVWFFFLYELLVDVFVWWLRCWGNKPRPEVEQKSTIHEGGHLFSFTFLKLIHPSLSS